MRYLDKTKLLMRETNEWVSRCVQNGSLIDMHPNPKISAFCFWNLRCQVFGQVILGIACAANELKLFILVFPRGIWTWQSRCSAKPISGCLVACKMALGSTCIRSRKSVLLACESFVARFLDKYFWASHVQQRSSNCTFLSLTEVCRQNKAVNAQN